MARAQELPEKIVWRIEGPFDSSYSLALLNRETARALDALGHRVVLHSTEGPGDFLPEKKFLLSNTDLEQMYVRSHEVSPEDADVTSRNLYPPRVADMSCRFNLLHHYAWEESGFPLQWADDFSTHLQGVTCLSSHVEKIMIDHGVTVPLSVSGCGVDHWEHIESDATFKVVGKKFKFLHVSSCFPRKGADLLLEAYGRVFTVADDVTLIVKTFPNPHNDIHRWLETARKSKKDFPDVVIIEDELSDSQLKALYGQCQALVAPSLAEGFGLPMAEAMLSGLAVITTGWGGQVDFCNEDTAWLVDYAFEPAQTHFNLYDSVWAVPCIDHLARTMRQVYELPTSQRMTRSMQGRQLLLDKFRWTDVAKRLVDSTRSWARKPMQTNPRVGWVTTWNTRCGIADYSAHLIGNMSADVSIFAARSDVIIEGEGPEVVRCWSAGEHDPLEELAKQVNERGVDTLVVQFNYGFFNLEHLDRFLTQQIEDGRTVVVAMHSTSDPVHAPHKKLEKLLNSLSRCHRILVHAPGDLNRLKRLGLVENVTLFPHGIPDYASTPRQPSSPLTSFTIASYGFFLPNKGLLELIDAMALLRADGVDIQLRMVNAEYSAPDSTTLIHQAKKEVSRLGLDKHIQMNTDFLADEDSLSLLADTDLLIFPYQQTGESSSAAVRYGIATERPVAVTPSVIFDDVAPAVLYLPGQSPSEIAQGIKQILQEIVNDSDAIQIKAKEANRWRDAHRYSRLGSRLCGLIQALHVKNLDI